MKCNVESGMGFGTEKGHSFLSKAKKIGINMGRSNNNMNRCSLIVTSVLYKCKMSIKGCSAWHTE